MADQDDLVPRPAHSRAARAGADLRTWLIVLIAIVVVVAALRAMAAVVVPVLFALFLTMVVAPVRDQIAARLPHWLRGLGHAAALMVIILGVAAFLGGIWIASIELVGLLPAMAERLEEVLDGTDWFSEAVTTMGTRLMENAGTIAGHILNSATSILVGLVLVLFFTLLMLIEGPRFQAAMDEVANARLEARMAGVVEVIATKLRIYLWTRIALGAATAGLYVLALWLFGVDLLLTWGLLAFFLNFIPTIGAVISGAIAVGYVFLTKDPTTGFVAALVILAIEQVMGNFVDPRVSGRQTALSTLVVLLALLFWGWVWGVAGALLAVPVTLSIMIVASRIPDLRPLALFLSDQRDMKGLDEVTR
jgi:AI-2 transport protein TqsA